MQHLWITKWEEEEEGGWNNSHFFITNPLPPTAKDARALRSKHNRIAKLTLAQYNNDSHHGPSSTQHSLGP
jgi:hypothetical protein